MTVGSAKWHAVRAVQVGSTIRCYLDDKLLLEATDDTFKEAGLIGLWSKSDAVSYFDHLSVKAPSKEAKAKE